MKPDAKTMQARYTPKKGPVIERAQVQFGTVRWSPCGNLLAAGSYVGTIFRWRWTGKEWAELPLLRGPHHGWMQALAFLPESRRLLAADSWGTIACWPYEADDARPAWVAPQAHEGWIRRIAVRPDGQQFATCGSDRHLRLFASTGLPAAGWVGHDHDILALAYHPDGKSLVSGDLFGEVRQWNVADGKQVRTFDCKAMYRLDRIQDVGGVRCLAFDPEGKYLIAAGSKPSSGGFVQGRTRLQVFDWDSGKLLLTSESSTENDGYILDVAWHADGFLMGVSSGQPGNGRLFFQRLDDAQPFVSLPLPNCHALAVAPDGKKLVVSATNSGSNGNGRPLKGTEYVGNHSPLHFFDLPASESPAR
jgi:WD40 repeat protein